MKSVSGKVFLTTLTIAIIAVVGSLSYYAYTFTDRYKAMKAFGLTSQEYDIYKKLNECNSEYDPTNPNGSFGKCGISSNDYTIAQSVINKINLRLSLAGLQ